ncbi:MAG TPA: hypothetical protein PKK00_09515 [Bacteroidales bacterium]|nr:hypothetical protein [Bacteroidales bacterium]HPS15860.1 hypothetical protein [Bacteroidales bacterium]
MEETKILEKYIPPESFPILSPLLEKYPVKIKIVKGRVSKFGDFSSSPTKNYIPEITINSNLNPYIFLITLLHEISHYIVWREGHFYAKPHGRNWKKHFTGLMNIMIGENVFPSDLVPFLNKHLQNPKATSCSDAKLFKELSKYDKDKPGVYIDDLLENTLFETKDGDLYKKIKKVRTRSLCENVKSGKKYLFSPVYRVFPITEKQYVMVFPIIF